MDKIGLIAGNGMFPIFFAQEAIKRKIEIVGIGIKGETDPRLEDMVQSFYWLNLGQLTKLINSLKKEDVSKAVMVGQIKHVNIFKHLALDLKALSLLKKLRDKKADTILGAVVDMLEKEGIEILPSTTFLSSLIPKKGIITKRTPTDEEEKDIAFGTKIAKGIAGLDIGQTVVVKNRSVVAVEAMEGTDETIMRGGRIGGKGIVVVKVSKPEQDIRFDVPVIGLKTLQTMIEAGASVLALDADKSIIFDQEEILTLSDRYGICIKAQ